MILIPERRSDKMIYPGRSTGLGSGILSHTTLVGNDFESSEFVPIVR